MATAVKPDGHSQLKARHLLRVLIVAFHSAVAVRYCLAAQREEKNGFPLTAALGVAQGCRVAWPYYSDVRPMLA